MRSGPSGPLLLFLSVGCDGDRPRRPPTNWCLGFPSTQAPHKLVPRIPVLSGLSPAGASDSRPRRPPTNWCLGFASTKAPHKLVPRIPVVSGLSLAGASDSRPRRLAGFWLVVAGHHADGDRVQDVECGEFLFVDGEDGFVLVCRCCGEGVRLDSVEELGGDLTGAERCHWFGGCHLGASFSFAKSGDCVGSGVRGWACRRRSSRM